MTQRTRTVSRQPAGGRPCPRCGRALVPAGRFCGMCGADTGAPAIATSMTGRHVPAMGDLLYVIAAAVLALTLAHTPLLDMLIYPFKLFATFVHEWSHALMTLATGGHVVALQINPDLSGEEYSAGGWSLPISSAGYLGTAGAGAALLLVPTRLARRTLVGIGATAAILPPAGALIQGTAFPLPTWLWSGVFAALTLAVGMRAAPRLARLFQQFLAVELCLTALDALRGLIWLTVSTMLWPPCQSSMHLDALRGLIWLTVSAPSVATDATNASRATHIPAVVWAILWSVIALAAIALSAVRLVRRAL